MIINLPHTGPPGLSAKGLPHAAAAHPFRPSDAGGAASQQRGSLDVELAQKNMGVQNLRERIQQKYQVNIDDVRSECITITYADEGAPKVQTLTPEEMATAGAATDRAPGRVPRAPWRGAAARPPFPTESARWCRWRTYRESRR